MGMADHEKRFGIGSSSSSPGHDQPATPPARATPQPASSTPPGYGYSPPSLTHPPFDPNSYPTASSDARPAWLPPPVFLPDAPQYPAPAHKPAATGLGPYHALPQPASSQPSSSSSSTLASYSLPASYPPYPYPSPPYAYLPYIPRVDTSSTMAITLPTYTTSSSAAANAAAAYTAAAASTTTTTSARHTSFASPASIGPQDLPRPENEHSDADESGEGESEPVSTRKRHGCIMCHKSFDRPCTLRKHMKVHTGEREFECQFCQRRFSVSSNKKRHERKCPHKPSTSSAPAEDASSSTPPTAAATSSSATPSVPPAAATSTPTITIPTSTPTTSRKRRRTPSPSPVHPSTTTTLPTSSGPRPKRRRRAPSPSTWIPDSLRAFDLTLLPKSTPVPLPPVQPSSNANEERDSFDDNVGEEPYHPRMWRGRLPGPALLEPESMGVMGVRVLVL